MLKIITNVSSTQGWGCTVCIQIGSIAFLVGKRKNKGCLVRVELFTPMRLFRIS